MDSLNYNVPSSSSELGRITSAGPSTEIRRGHFTDSIEQRSGSRVIRRYRQLARCPSCVQGTRRPRSRSHWSLRIAPTDVTTAKTLCTVSYGPSRTVWDLKQFSTGHKLTISVMIVPDSELPRKPG